MRVQATPGALQRYFFRRSSISKATRPQTQPHCRLEQPHHALERGVGL